MRRNLTVRTLLIGMIFAVLLVSCGGDDPPEEIPTLMPTAVLPDRTDGEEAETDPDAEPTEPPTALGERATPTPVPTPLPVVNPADIDWEPQLVYSSPAPGEEVTLSGALTLRFDQPMDQESVEDAFSVETADSATITAVSGMFDWPRPDTVIFTPQESYDRARTYRVQVSGEAQSANGQALRQPIDLRLQSVGFLQISDVIPAPNTNNVPTDGAITVLFNRPVVPLVSTGQQADLPQPLVIDPSLEGEGRWVTTSIYRFVPANGFAGATEYLVDVLPGLEDVTGAVLEDGASWAFITLAPEVTTVFPEPGMTDVIPVAPLRLTFNMPMEPASTEAAIVVRGANASAGQFEYAWAEDGRSVTLTPIEPLTLGAEYEIVVGTGAQAATGAVSLGEPFSSGFTTVPLPTIRELIPAANSVPDRFQRGVNIIFSAPIDPDTLEDQLIIDPAPQSTVRYNFYNNDFELYVDFSYEPETEYTITVPASVADPYGNTLPRAFTWTFTSPIAQPVASFNLTAPVSMLSTSFATDVDLILRNVPQASVRLYDLGLPLGLLSEPYRVNDNGYRPSSDPLSVINYESSAASGEVEVANLSLANGGTLLTGIYLLTVNEDQSDDLRYWQNQRNLLVIADTNLVIKEMFDEVHVWATNVNSGQAAPNVPLTLYDVRGVALGTAVSDGNGFATISYETRESYLEGVIVVSGSPSEAGFGIASTRLGMDLEPWQQGISYDTSAETPLFTYLYTDRPIYRPGDTIFFKGIVREQNFGRYALPSDETVTIFLDQSSYSPEPGLSETFTLDVAPDGTFSGDFTIPEDAPLATYAFSFERQDFRTSRSFTIAEYRAPEFEVLLTPAQPELLRSEATEVVVEATYFFGGTAAGLPINYTLYEESFLPMNDGPFYLFGDGGNFFYEDSFFFQPNPRQYLLDGQGMTDANGRFAINIPADILEDADTGSRRLIIEASVSDLSEFPVLTTGEVVFHAADGYVGIIPTDYFTAAGQEAGVELLTTDWNGRSAPNHEVEVVFYRREWVSERLDDFGDYRTVYTPIDTEVARTTVTTDGQGEAEASFTPAEGGTFVAVATYTDSSGHVSFSSANLWVSDSDFVGWRTDARDNTMDLVLDQTDYEVGDTARILVQSPFEQSTQAWLTIERGDLLEQRLITIDGGSDTVEIDIPLAFAPNAFVMITAVKPVTPEDADAPFADIRVGLAELKVSPQPLSLNVMLTPQDDQLIPGETAVYDIQVTANDGSPVEANLSLALVDLAVLSLKDDNAPPILEAFYSPQSLRSELGGTLFLSAEGLPIEVPNEVLGRGGGGGDIAANEAVARLEQEDGDEVRRDFPDTAFWEATVQTNGSGRASVEIPLPDSLTTWQLSSKAVTVDSLVGQGFVDVQSSLPLLLRPVTPRFMTVGDQIALGTIINNNTASDIEAVVTLEANGITLADDAIQTVNVPAGGQTLVRWLAAVDDVETADLTFRVEGGGFRDATKPTFGIGDDNLIPVYRYTGNDTVDTAGVLDDANVLVEAVLLPEGVDLRQGKLELELSASLGGAIIEGLSVLDRQPFDATCAHSLANRLLPNVATYEAITSLGLNEPELQTRLETHIAADANRLASLQKSDGGWGWCVAPQSDPFLSAYSLLTLAKAEQTGLIGETASAQAVVNQGIGYINRQLDDPARFNSAVDVNRQAFFLYVLAENGAIVGVELDQLLSEQQSLLDPYAKALMLLAYDLSGGSGGNADTLLADLSGSAAVSATGTHWEDASRDFRNLNSDVRGTAMVLYALSRVDSGNPLAPGTVRWLITARSAQIWPTAHETAWSLFALSEWLQVTDELEAGYGYETAVNLQPLLEGTFGEANVLESEQVSVPLGSLVMDEVNFVQIGRGGGNGRLYYSLFLNSAINVSQIEPVKRGISVVREYFDAACDPEETACEPISEIEVGQQVRVELTVIAENDLLYAVIEDPIPAGAVAIDPSLNTTGGVGGSVNRGGDEAYRYGYWGYWFFNRIEYRDEAVHFLADFLPAGTYQYTYLLDTTIPGEFQVRPAVAQQEFFPDVFGRSDGLLFAIVE